MAGTSISPSASGARPFTKILFFHASLFFSFFAHPLQCCNFWKSCSNFQPQQSREWESNRIWQSQVFPKNTKKSNQTSRPRIIHTWFNFEPKQHKTELKPNKAEPNQSKLFRNKGSQTSRTHSNHLQVFHSFLFIYFVHILFLRWFWLENVLSLTEFVISFCLFPFCRFVKVETHPHHYGGRHSNRGAERERKKERERETQKERENPCQFQNSPKRI